MKSFRKIKGIKTFRYFILILVQVFLATLSVGNVSATPDLIAPDLYYQTINIPTTSVCWPYCNYKGPYYDVYWAQLTLYWTPSSAVKSAWVALRYSATPPDYWGTILVPGANTITWSNIDHTKPVYIFVAPPGFGCITYYGTLTLGVGP